MSHTVQWILVGLAVAAAVVYFVRRFRRGRGGCDDCPLSDLCRRRRS